MSILPQIECSLATANAHTEGDRLIVCTGKVQRIWQWTGCGFSTCKVLESRSGRQWTRRENNSSRSDWQLPDGSEPEAAERPNLSAQIQNDDGFTSEHICVNAEITYPAQELTVKFTIWVYPNAWGIRTQLAAKRTAGAATPEPHVPRLQGKPPAARSEQIALPQSPKNTKLRRRFLGYYNDTQRRNDTHQSLLKEEKIEHPLQGREWCDWASAACIEDDAGGIALVKESHKCVNQPGYDSGGFICDENDGLSSTGWGLQIEELSSDHFTTAWATWCVLWAGGDLAREIAFKTFDRTRYPIDSERDIYIQANTWGSTDNSSDARRAAGQASVLEEIATCAELGIDVLQIDDGWQVPLGSSSWQPGENGWHPHPQTYPEGWAPIRASAQAQGIKLGLWAAAIPIHLEELKSNYTQGGFCQYKLDFASLRNRPEIDALMQKVREFIQWTDHKVRVNWDVTENQARYGYFYAREYGCIFLENRKPDRPYSVVYRPHTVLRDIWQVSKYLNSNRFQCVIQNIDTVNQALSDAHAHTHAYAVAIALMGIPLFFQETKYYSKAAKQEIRPLIELYKAHRASIYRGIVHPIGAQPDNASWTGFQCHLEDEKRGYLLLFRERCNAQDECTIQLGWLAKTTLTVTNLINGKSAPKPIGSAGEACFQIKETPGFLFLQYSENDT
jgi:hypothetical protein